MRVSQLEDLENYGWIIHYIFDDKEDGHNGMVNAHTHGLPHTYNHPDLQITLPLESGVANGILEALVEFIKDGRRFFANKRYSDMLVNDDDIYFIEATESRRPVLRAILPDNNGRFPFDEGCEAIFDRQMYTLPDGEETMN